MKIRVGEDRCLLLDGGIGRELRFRGVEVPDTIWAAGSLITDPDVVEQIHVDYIEAGADIITTNTYGVIKSDLAKEGIADRFAELNTSACRLAVNARKRSGRDVLIAGSLPPLRGSFRPDLVGRQEEIEPLYEEQACLLAPYVDLFLCETMSSTAEGYAAAKAAAKFNKPVWVAWTLDEDQSGNLRSGQSVKEAARALRGLAVSGFLANCSAPESITRFVAEASEEGFPWYGGYGNTFTPIPRDWTLNGEKETDGLLTLRQDLDPSGYGVFVKQWLAGGANVIGGCCGTRPGHTVVMRQILNRHEAQR